MQRGSSPGLGINLARIALMSDQGSVDKDMITPELHNTDDRSP
ncbi:hypothetical protein SynBIOSE41_03084 [Synechococcus sp. BIOS-E4-1]|nr:hypothetical protein SynBIOSE41_03084 [Synechococcus sp. BIOS-E4-1]